MALFCTENKFRSELINRKRGNNMIYTVFPKDKDELPQDFSTQEEAVAYGIEYFGESGYVIESTTGECL